MRKSWRNTTANRIPAARVLSGVSAALMSLLLAGGCGGSHPITEAETFPFERAAGEVLGAELSAAVPRGGLLLVLTRSDADGREALQQEALLAGLSAGAPNFLPHPVGPNLSPAGAQAQTIEQRVAAEGWPPRAFLKWCRTNPEAAAVVSLIDFPANISSKDLSRIPPLFVYSTNPNSVANVREMVSARKIRAAIIPRGGADDSAKAEGTAAEIVARRYEVLK